MSVTESGFKRWLLRLVLAFATAVALTLAFSSVAMAQYVTFDSSGDCLGAADQLQSEQPNVQERQFENLLNFVPDVGGCIILEGSVAPQPVNALNAVVYEPNTGEELGLVKDLDPDLSSGANSTTYQEFCRAFPVVEQTAQQYYEQDANAKEQTY